MAALPLLHPALLVGLAGAAFPLLIHLIFLAKPRRIRFPAVALLRGDLLAGHRSQRLSHWGLLLLRSLLIAILAVALAQPYVRNAPQSSAEPSGSAEVAVVMDNSVS